MKQMNFFDGTQKFRNDKPIRLIELFAGYGSQALALKYLGVQFEHYRISEWATKSIQAYKDLHATDDRTDYSQGLTPAEIKAWLTGKISTDYSTPATAEQIGRLSEKTARTLYNNMRATRNIGSITQATADDLAIVNTAEFLYIMTYSFPCQDLSVAGNGAGMGKGSGTRSGLLWEVERLLSEISNGGRYALPQVLLMENVPQVIGGGAIADFVQWREFLEGLGYKNYTQLMNAKGYAIPQNRNRCFMVSILGDYDYIFPPELPLQYHLKDFLERNVEEKYYLSDATIEMFMEHTARHQEKGNGFKFEPMSEYRFYQQAIETLCENDCEAGDTIDAFNKKINKSGISPTITTRPDGFKTAILTVTPDSRIRKLTERECFRLMGVKGEGFEKIAKSQSMSSLYHLAGDSIVTTCLMAIFGELLSVDYTTKINELTE